MTARLLDGKKVAQGIREDVAKKTEELKSVGLTPGLTVVLVGDDPASKVYVGQKEKACKEVGFKSDLLELSGATTQEELLEVIGRLNGDPSVHGILVQLPLPRRIDPDAVLEAIDPAKDVDGFHPVNVGHLVAGIPCMVPCTPLGVVRMLESYGIDLAGKHAVIVGRSAIVGKPMAHLLLAKDCTVTICHSRTPDLASFTRQADLLVAAVGRPRLITADMVKPGAVVVDVGINRLETGLVGDVDFEAVREVAGWVTPVPGGVGPLTIAMLLENTLTAAIRSRR
ncbi:MAG: bifunctional methylenetetrahydrofolate dehydrogenase/methenyltetrahydrofolate cyclohydrolase FolD [Synergistales bacterium]|jgi:methylenetetrahydrofolate dehydrogenase (NADP+)/methenyltetrahydrofolate cyclohydrolase